jgi:hypothetical protein
MNLDRSIFFLASLESSEILHREADCLFQSASLGLLVGGGKSSSCASKKLADKRRAASSRGTFFIIDLFYKRQTKLTRSCFAFKKKCETIKKTRKRTFGFFNMH